MMPPEFRLEQTVLGAPVVARVQRVDTGVRAEIYGGTRPHIGAFSVADPAGAVQTTEFPGHREGVVAARWAQALADAGLRPAVVLAGIHYDGLRKAEIEQVVAATDALLRQALERLRTGP